MRETGKVSRTREFGNGERAGLGSLCVHYTHGTLSPGRKRATSYFTFNSVVPGNKGTFNRFGTHFYSPFPVIPFFSKFSVVQYSRNERLHHLTLRSFRTSALVILQ